MMPAHLTPDEEEGQYLKALGPDLGLLMFHLQNENIWLNWKWREYTTLYGAKSSRIELLNEAAPVFFRIIQDVLWEDVLLHISRITDPPRSAGKDNLTVQRLPPLVATEIRPEVDVLLEDVSAKCEFATDWRKRHIAHRDLALAIDKAAKALAHASRLLVNQAIESIGALLNRIDGHYRKAETYYKGGPRFGNAEDLLYVLRDGIEVEVQRRTRHETGKLLPEDVTPRPIV